MNGASALRASGAALTQAAGAFVVGILTARFLGPTGQGLFTTVLTVVTLSVVTLTLGSGTALRVRARPRPTPTDVAGYLSLSGVVTLVAAAVSPVVVLLVLRQHLEPHLLVITALLGAVLMLARQAADACQAVGKAHVAIYSTPVLAGTQLATVLVVLATTGLTTSSALLAALLGGLAQMAFCFRTLRHELPWKGRPSWAAAKPLVVLGVPSLGYTVGLLTLQRVDRIILGAVSGPTTLGVYAAAATLAEAIRLLPSVVGQLIFSRVAEHGGVPPDALRVRRHLLAITALMVVLLELMAPLIPVILGEAYRPSIPVFRVLLLAELFMGAALIDTRISLGLGSVHGVSATTIVWVVLSIPLYCLGSWTAGAMGSAVATVVLYVGYAATIRVRRPSVQLSM